MKLAFAYDGDKVLDFFELIKNVHIYDIQEEKVLEVKNVPIEDPDPNSIMGKLLEEKVELLICGNIDEHGTTAARNAGLMLIRDVNGYEKDLVDGYIYGYLEPETEICARAGNGSNNRW